SARLPQALDSLRPRERLGGGAPVAARGVSHRNRAPRASAVGVERLAVRDRENPRAQVRVWTQARICAHRRHERLLKAVLDLAATHRRAQEAPHVFAIAVEEALKRWQ